MSNDNENNYPGARIKYVVGTAAANAEDKFDGQQTELRILLDTGYKDKKNNGEWVKTGTNAYTVIASGDAAAALRTVGKGDRVRVDDAAQEIREHKKQDGSTGYSVELRFGTLTVVKRKGDGAPAAVAPATTDTW